MSLQNLLKPNNYPLELGTVNASNIHSSNVYTDNIYEDENLNDQITIHATLTTTADEGASLGIAGKGFQNLFCKNLNGLNANVNVVHGLNGGSGTSAVSFGYGVTGPTLGSPVTVNGGLVFNVAGNSVLNFYQEYSGSLTVSGALSASSTPPVTSVPYSGVIIGKLATVSFQTLLANAGASGTINLSGLPTAFKPLSTQSIFVPTDVNNTQNNSCLIISNAANPLISIFSAANESTSFTNGQPSGLKFASSRWFTFTYVLN